MAIDTIQKRMSARFPACPWRGASAYAPTSGFTTGNRQAAAFMYSFTPDPQTFTLSIIDSLGISDSVSRSHPFGGGSPSRGRTMVLSRRGKTWELTRSDS